jgi:hypothetical protein
LTDDAETLTDLVQSGCELDTPRRKALLQTTLNGFGVHLTDNAITIKAKQDSLALRKRNLIQAILAVNDLFYVARANIESFFFEDVARWMDGADIRYTQRVKFAGRTAYDQVFDFVVPKSKREPERILRVVNNPVKDQANAVILSWMDTKDARPSNSVTYAILNDKRGPCPMACLKPGGTTTLRRCRGQSGIGSKNDSLLKPFRLLAREFARYPQIGN